MSTTPPPSGWRQSQGDWGTTERVPPGETAYPPPPPPSQSQYGYGYGPPAAYPVAEYAEWWRRVLAIFLDGLLVGVPLFILAVATGIVETTNTSDANGAFVGFHAGPAWFGLSLIVPLLYYGLLEGGPRGASVGKMALGIQIRDAQTGGPIGFGKAVLRRFIYEILWYLLFVPGLINALSPLWDSRKQAWHDKAVNSVVVRT